MTEAKCSVILGWFIAGLIVVSAAAGIVSIFLAAPSDCVNGGV